jgi:phytoene synthase
MTPATEPHVADLSAAQHYCHDVTRRSGTSFYNAFRLLAPERRAGLEAVYAFCRFVDDIADDETKGNPAVLLARWREELDRVWAGTSEHPIGVALQDAVQRFHLPRQPMDDLIDGVAMDLKRRRYDTWDELEQYCYRVASTVGLLCIEIFGRRHAQTRQYAIDLGIAFQLTNILRDVREDAQRGRIYLPLEDLARFGVSEEELLAARWTPAVGALLAFECGRARAYYLRAKTSIVHEDERALAPAEAMRLIYERLLHRIESRRFDVFAERVTLPTYEKVGLALAAWGRSQLRALGAV